ncbi:hypothetical protein HUW51_05115 [Adhaeribacter swui]|uniref:Uncharacterized protein n=1 Tax=Adhaeribacter swui TaxID=2086471 RepID=A0A7G7G4Q6_9BACT|nr:hypothetical protein [Adhaeribacter swui]QNF32140.1 hypothetical protein HUW51_05115 [Adhaeribacter swui]
MLNYWRVMFGVCFGFMLWQPMACKPKDKQQATVKNVQVSHLPMKATLLRQKLLTNLPSGSGMEIIHNQLFVIGDDSPLLYQLQADTWEQIATYPLFQTNDFATGRIPKPLKPDLECLTRVKFKKNTYLLAFGSGSTAKRNTCFVVQLAPTTQEKPSVQAISLQYLYEALQNDIAVTAGGTLNLEAAAASPEHLYLLQRSGKDGPDALLIFPLPAFMAYLQQPTGSLPAYTVIRFRLPEIDGWKAGFSGTSFYDNKIFITASVENTNDAYLDGEVLGSFVGYIPVNQAPDAVVHTTRIIDPKGNFYSGKVESISILRKNAANQYQALAITDNDNGQSELLELELTLP